MFSIGEEAEQQAAPAIKSDLRTCRTSHRAMQSSHNYGLRDVRPDAMRGSSANADYDT